MRDYFFGDTERENDKQEARGYKSRAKDAMTRKMFKNTAGWGETYKRWRENKSKLIAMRENGWKPAPKGFEPDWGKVGYTASIQLMSALIAVGCILGGVWPLIFLTAPALIALNGYFLLKDREG